MVSFIINGKTEMQYDNEDMGFYPHHRIVLTAISN